MFTYLRFSYRIFVASLVLILSLINSASPLKSQTQDVELQLDDGTFEVFLGFNGNPGFLGNRSYVPPAYPATLRQVKFFTNGAQQGSEVRIHVYVDETGQADRPDAGLSRGSVSAIIVFSLFF